jgi:urease accessory protein UreE
MITYLVTLEIQTPWWKKVLRFFRLMKQREEFKLTLYPQISILKKGDILNLEENKKVVILKRI